MAFVLSGSSIGRYLVKRKLAEGGMAELYLCTAVGPEGFEKEVVIKRIKEFLSSDQGFIDMFKAEARLASRLNHANVVQIFDFDKHDDAWFIAMEYVYGASLWDLRRRCRELAMPFPPILVAEIGAQVARGLHYAHTLTDKGKPLALVHRDVTPHNVLLSFDGGVKLTDFGIAKAGTSFTAPGMLKGKFAYMSPEQARGEKVDARTDVFALGITLWEMLTGGRLFEGDSDIAVLRAVQESLIASPARLNPDVPVELSEVVLKALARPLGDRYQTAHELDRALAHFVLKNSASTDDANIGLFLRQMFRDELEEAERAMTAEHSGASPQTSQTPVVDAYGLGGTLQFERHHEPKTQQTATPIPIVTTADRPKTAQMPGVRAGRLFEDPFAKRTEKLEDVFGSGQREATAQMPTPQGQRKFSPVMSETAPLPSDFVPGAGLAPSAPSLPGPISDTESVREPPFVEAPFVEAPKKSLLPGIIAACLSVGLIAGLGIAVQQSKNAAPAIIVAAPVAAVAEVKPAVIEGVKTAEVVPEKVVEAPLPPAKVEVPAPVETRQAASARGTLQIEAIPYGELFINNKKVADVEGAKKIPLAPGVYAVRIEHPKQIKNESVTIKSGQTSLLKFYPLK